MNAWEFVRMEKIKVEDKWDCKTKECREKKKEEEKRKEEKDEEEEKNNAE